MFIKSIILLVSMVSSAGLAFWLHKTNVGYNSAIGAIVFGTLIGFLCGIIIILIYNNWLHYFKKQDTR